MEEDKGKGKEAEEMKKEGRRRGRRRGGVGELKTSLLVVVACKSPKWNYDTPLSRFGGKCFMLSVSFLLHGLSIR